MIACDLDGVVCNFIEGYTKAMKHMYPGAPIVDDYMKVQHWSPDKWYWPEGYSFTRNEAVWRYIKHSPSFWYELKPLFHSDMEYLKNLHRKNIVFMTRRDGPMAWNQSVAWLERYGILEPLVVRVTAGEEKEHLCKDMGINILIDDAPKYIESAMQNGLTVVKLTWPYNNHVRTPYEAYTLKEALVTAVTLDTEKHAAGSRT